MLDDFFRLCLIFDCSYRYFSLSCLFRSSSVIAFFPFSEILPWHALFWRYSFWLWLYIVIVIKPYAVQHKTSCNRQILTPLNSWLTIKPGPRKLKLISTCACITIRAIVLVITIQLIRCRNAIHVDFMQKYKWIVHVQKSPPLNIFSHHNSKYGALWSWHNERVAHVIITARSRNHAMQFQEIDDKEHYFIYPEL